MARGDQIYVMRELMGIPEVYQHHGIDCGDGTVIHFRKGETAVISRTSWEQFARGNPVFVKQQPVAYIPDVVIERAESRLGEKQYNLFVNNCEHFATWCKTGRNESTQLHQYGLRPADPFKSRHLIHQATYTEDPVRSLALFRQATANIFVTQQTLQGDRQLAQEEVKTWHRVAQKALKKGREDLARAALKRKVDAKKKVATCQQHLDQLQDMYTTLEANSQILRQRLAT